MKILMIGLGSIGQRHLRNIKRVYGEEAQILAYRVRGLKRTFSDTMQIRENVSLEEEYNIKSFADLSKALLEKPDIAYITNITKSHIPCAIACAKAGCHLFLEKPISDSLDGIEELAKIVAEKKLKVFVGYQNRFHPGIQYLKQFLAEGSIGRILSVRSVVGERLTTMHTYENYKDTYMARKDMGGGVLLNQMCMSLIICIICSDSRRACMRWVALTEIWGSMWKTIWMQFTVMSQSREPSRYRCMRIFTSIHQAVLLR